jgi:hypothetical protein
MHCASCNSEELGKFPAEIAIHLPGLTNISKPHIFVFPPLLVCMRCGCVKFVLSEDELHRLAEPSVKWPQKDQSETA